MPTPLASPLVAVDANVVMDLGAGSESVLDALATVRQRLGSPRFVIPPTAKLELIHIVQQADSPEDRNLALEGITAARKAGIIYSGQSFAGQSRHCGAGCRKAPSCRSNSCQRSERFANNRRIGADGSPVAVVQRRASARTGF